jgi:hypothetical protein
MIAAHLKNCLENSKKTISNYSKSKRRWKTILKSREVHFLDFISYPMMSYLKFYHKLEILMLYRLILENASIISIELSLLMLSNQNKLCQ